jgi:hypothetical protein
MRVVRKNTIAIAEDIPEAQYDYRPTPDSRSVRETLLEDAARKRYIVAPDHLPFPGLGHIRKDGRAYTWVPVDYVNDAVEK